MKTYLLKFIILVFWGISLVEQVYPQSSASDSLFHPYKVNYWVTAPIIGVGLVTNYIGIPLTQNKDELTPLEIEALKREREILNGFDSWALKQDPSQIDVFEKYSDYTLMTGVVLPALLLFDKQIRKDWSDVLLIYLETMSITPNIYEWSFLGPAFQNRIRPVAYYDQLTFDQKKAGNNRNSFYSGHVASVAASTFFMAKVFSDYHPEIGAYEYLLYAAATIPPLVLGYFRVKALKHFPSDVIVGLAVGAFCGIIIPEFHRLSEEDIKLGLYSNSEAIGITLNWQPNILK